VNGQERISKTTNQNIKSLHDGRLGAKWTLKIKNASPYLTIAFINHYYEIHDSNLRFPLFPVRAFLIGLCILLILPIGPINSTLDPN